MPQFYQWTCPEPIFRQGRRACTKNLVSGDETSCRLNNVVKFSEPPPSVSHAVNKQLGFDPQHWVVLFLPFFFSTFVSLFMGSLSLQTMVNTWQYFYYFFKACTKGYIVNSCLTLPLHFREHLLVEQKNTVLVSLLDGLSSLADNSKCMAALSFIF